MDSIMSTKNKFLAQLRPCQIPKIDIEMIKKYMKAHV